MSNSWTRKYNEINKINISLLIIIYILCVYACKYIYFWVIERKEKTRNHRLKYIAGLLKFEIGILYI